MPIDPKALAAALQGLRDAAQAVEPVPVATYLKAVVDQAAAILRVECVGVLLLDGEGRIRTAVTTGPAARALEHAQEELGSGPGVQALATAAPLAVADLAENPEWAELDGRVRTAGVRAVLAAPIMAGGEVVGNLNAIQAEPFDWPADTVAAAQAFAGIVGALLDFAAGGGRTRDPPDGGLPASGGGPP